VKPRYNSTPSLTSALYGVGGQRHSPVALPPRKTRYSLYRRLGRPQGLSGQVRKISPTTRVRSSDRPAHSKSLYRSQNQAMHCYVCYWALVSYMKQVQPVPKTAPSISYSPFCQNLSQHTVCIECCFLHITIIIVVVVVSYFNEEVLRLYKFHIR
jgi:hypothetical protein